MHKKSLISLLLSFAILWAFAFLYYPKWEQYQTEATISWDVSGYYFYLPAIFIYKDLKQLKFKDQILSKYKPTYNLEQAYLHESGNYVLKYSAGQAIVFSPFFAIAHLYASASPQYEADGFSRPYQLMISIGSLLIAFLGLWFLRKILLVYFSDQVTAITLFSIAIGTNYLEYSSISGALTHNSLFTIYSMLLYQSHRFYQQPSYKKALWIGGLIGLAALIRPTEILGVFIPVLWGLSPTLAAIRERIGFFQTHFSKIILAVVTCGLIGFIQLAYWKYATGDWIVYSYQDAGFDWLKPHLWEGIFSYQSGWLVYSPILIFAIVGFIPLYRSKTKAGELFWMSLSFSLVFTYLVFAWSVWLYGGCLGIRAMVQSYPIFALPFAALVSVIVDWKWAKILIYSIFGIFIYYNIWLTTQLHRNGVIHVGNMTKAYFWQVLGQYGNQDINDLKLLDTDEDYRGERKNVQVIFQEDFENIDSSKVCPELPTISGKQSLCLNKDNQFSEEYFINFNKEQGQWVRANATFYCLNKESNLWAMAQFYLRFYDQQNMIKHKMIKVHRLLEEEETKSFHLDIKVPQDLNFQRVSVMFWNAGGDKSLLIDDLVVESFEEE